MHVVIFLILLLLVLLGPQYWVKWVLNKYNQQAEENFTGTGGELARHLLDRVGLSSVQAESTSAGDHYDPQDRAVRLQEQHFNGKTLTAITIAAHEVGHAIQHARGESLFLLRMRLARVAVVTQKLGSLLLFLVPLISIVTRVPAIGLLTLLAAFLVMGMGLLVHILTLPVEIDASFKKALPMLEGGYLLPGQLVPARRILRAAALTYVSAALSGLLNFWRWMQVMKR